MRHIIWIWLFAVVSLVGTAASAAEDWVDEVVAESLGLLKSRSVSQNSPNTVYVLNATSGEHMPAIDERREMNRLTKALRGTGWMQVFHGSALDEEAYTRDNSPNGRKQMYDLLAGLSDSTITIFVVPLARVGGVVHAEVVFLVRNIENGETHLTNAYGINVDIPVEAEPPKPETGTRPEETVSSASSKVSKVARRSICAPNVDALEVWNVSEFATLRSGTDYQDRILGEAPRGTTVDLTGDRRLAKPAKSGHCEELCRAEIGGTLAGSQRAALTGCIEDDVFWFRVKAASGAVGWMSGKYLRFLEPGRDSLQRQSICAPAPGTLVVTNVNEFATLRSGTDYYDRLLGEAPLGTAVQYDGARRLAKPTISARCEELCRGEIGGGLAGSDRAELASCIDVDVFWFHVRTDRGQSGWMSAKFLRVGQSGLGN